MVLAKGGLHVPSSKETEQWALVGAGGPWRRWYRNQQVLLGQRGRETGLVSTEGTDQQGFTVTWGQK